MGKLPTPLGCTRTNRTAVQHIGNGRGPDETAGRNGSAGAHELDVTDDGEQVGRALAAEPLGPVGDAAGVATGEVVHGACSRTVGAAVPATAP